MRNTRQEIQKAFKAGATIERLCYTTHEGKAVYAKVLNSGFEDSPDKYRIV